jgi:DNA-binding XRE family transcriptional regulator
MAEKSEQIEENLVKKTCRELGITQKELAEKIGVSESGLKTAISRNSLSNQMMKNIELLLENKKLQKELRKAKDFKENLKEFILS